MDDKKKQEEEQSYIEVLKEVQKKMPNIVFPSMGMIDNEVKININGKDFFRKSDNN